VEQLLWVVQPVVVHQLVVDQDQLVLVDQLELVGDPQALADQLVEVLLVLADRLVGELQVVEGLLAWVGRPAVEHLAVEALLVLAVQLAVVLLA